MLRSTTHEVNRYVVRNSLAMIGTSAYIIIDTLFISVAAGPLGLTTLNLSLPIFYLMNAIGLLLGVGGSAIFSLNKVKHPKRVESLFSQLVLFGAFCGFLMMLSINLFITPVVHFLGANQNTIQLAVPYIRIAACASPLVIVNYLTVNFVRNDADPNLTMIASLSGTGTVILADWLLIFVCQLNMIGAAIAYLLQPTVSLLVLTHHRHFVSRQLKWQWCWPHWHFIRRAASLGASSALNELGNGVSVYFFNQTLLSLAGNYAVAAYGIISNLAIVFNAIANGIALGVQPVASREYGVRHYGQTKAAFFQGLRICLVVTIIGYLLVIGFKQPLIALFNSQHQSLVTHYASFGLPIYFTALPFLSFNILTALFLAGTNSPRFAFTISFLRGYVLLIPLIMLLGWIGGVYGVFGAVPLTELFVTLIGGIILITRFQAMT